MQIQFARDWQRHDFWSWNWQRIQSSPGIAKFDRSLKKVAVAGVPGVLPLPGWLIK
jgi:hypothetical protein